MRGARAGLGAMVHALRERAATDNGIVNGRPDQARSSRHITFCVAAVLTAALARRLRQAPQSFHAQQRLRVNFMNTIVSQAFPEMAALSPSKRT
jgi:hypothetical protein